MSFFNNLSSELGTGIGKAINSFFSWIFRWEKVSGEHPLRSNSFRIATISFILSIIFIPGLVTCSFKPINTFNEYVLPKNKGEVEILIQLGNDDGYTYPNLNRFVPKGDNTTIVFYRYEDNPNIPYYYYQKRTDGEIPIIDVKDTLCAIIPLGKKIMLRTKSIPRFVANMKDDVTYAHNKAELSTFQKIKIYLGNKHPFIKNAKWSYLANNWHVVNTTEFPILVTALETSEIKDKNAGGGLICF